MLWCFAVFSRGFPGKHKHTKHQISQAQLKAEKETSAKALAECEKLKAQVRPKLDDELIVGSSKMNVEEYLLVKSVSGKELAIYQWLFGMAIFWGEIWFSLRGKKTSNLPGLICIPHLLSDSESILVVTIAWGIIWRHFVEARPLRMPIAPSRRKSNAKRCRRTMQIEGGWRQWNLHIFPSEVLILVLGTTKMQAIQD